MDISISYLNYKTHLRIFERLLPTPPYYHPKQTRKVTRQGVLFKLYPHDLSQWLIFSDRNDHYVDAVISTIDPDLPGTILDIGANIGHFSFPLAETIRRKNWKKNIIAFEPNPIIFQQLTEIRELNKRLKGILTIENMALGSEETICEIQIPHRNSGLGSLTENYENEPHDAFTISVHRLDNILNSNRPIDFIKIDTEGFEYFVLTGAQELLQKFKPAIYFETISGQPNQEKIFKMLRDLGYIFRRDTLSGFVSIEGTRQELASMNCLANILATKT